MRRRRRRRRRRRGRCAPRVLMYRVDVTSRASRYGISNVSAPCGMHAATRPMLRQIGIKMSRENREYSRGGEVLFLPSQVSQVARLFRGTRWLPSAPASSSIWRVLTSTAKPIICFGVRCYRRAVFTARHRAGVEDTHCFHENWHADEIKAARTSRTTGV